MRPIETSSDGTRRFVGNSVVRYVLAQAVRRKKCNLDHLSAVSESGAFTESEMREFYQLIGFSVRGYQQLFDVDVPEQEATQ